MNLFERWDRIIEGGLQRLVQHSLGPGAGVHFLESYERALEDVEAKAQAVAAGRVFPFKRVVLRFGVGSSEEATALDGILSHRKQISEELRLRLESSGCTVPSPVRVDASAIASDNSGLAAGGYEVFCYTELPPQPALLLRVTKGRAERGSYTLSHPVINVGRLAEVYDDRRRLLRRNHIVFLDDEHGANSTVSRMHAHIAFNPETGWYRLYDDGSRFGTRICRDTRIIDVPSGPEGGAWLRSGDELHLGGAQMELDINER